MSSPIAGARRMRDALPVVGRRRADDSPNRPRSMLRQKLGILTGLEKFAIGAVLVILVLAVIGPWIAPYPTETADPTARLQPPDATHWLGTDQNGIDIFSRILAAPRIDVTIAVVATLLSVFIGSPLGVLVGFFEGTRRRIASLLSEGMLRLLDVIQAFPVFILAMVLVAVRGTSMINIIIAIAFVNTPVFLRLVRTELLSLREQPYAEAARAVGTSDLRIGFRHLLPNAIPPIMVQISVTIGFAILLTAGLSFVGAGISPPTPELGAMIATGATSIVIGQWWPSVFPGIALGLTIFAFAVTGEALGRLLEPGVGRRSDDGHGSAIAKPAGLVASASPTAAVGDDERHTWDIATDLPPDRKVPDEDGA